MSAGNARSDSRSPKRSSKDESSARHRNNPGRSSRRLKQAAQKTRRAYDEFDDVRLQKSEPQEVDLRRKPTMRKQIDRSDVSTRPAPANLIDIMFRHAFPNSTIIKMETLTWPILMKIIYMGQVYVGLCLIQNFLGWTKMNYKDFPILIKS